MEVYLFLVNPMIYLTSPPQFEIDRAAEWIWLSQYDICNIILYFRRGNAFFHQDNH